MPTKILSVNHSSLLLLQNTVVFLQKYYIMMSLGLILLLSVSKSVGIFTCVAFYFANEDDWCGVTTISPFPPQ